MRDLCEELAVRGHEPVVIVPDSGLTTRFVEEKSEGVTILRLAAPRTRGLGWFRRAMSEMWLPFAMIRSLRGSNFSTTRWDSVVWYSPPVFFGPLIRLLRKRSSAVTYLILRDIFPEWALDLGLIRKGPIYALFLLVATYQYAQADVIGVQTPSNLKYLEKWSASPNRRLEVLQNWLAPAVTSRSSIVIDNTSLAGRKIFVYVGNMGVAQGMDVLIELARALQHRDDIGFLFVGRGSEYPRLVRAAEEFGLSNVVFSGEVDSGEIPGLLAQCHVGLLALDPRHRTHNIPGKFLAYERAGLPVLANVNNGTDLMLLINREEVGIAGAFESIERLRAGAESLVDNPEVHRKMSANGRALWRKMFSRERAVDQVLNGLAEARGGFATSSPTSVAEVG